MCAAHFSLQRAPGAHLQAALCIVLWCSAQVVLHLLAPHRWHILNLPHKVFGDRKYKQLYTMTPGI
jgi:hypothetical protein